MATEYYYARDGQRFGPVSGKQLRELATTGQLQPADLIWSPEKNEWLPAAKIKALFAAAAPPSQAATVAAAPASTVSPLQPGSNPMPVSRGASAPFGNIVAGIDMRRWGLIAGISAGSLVGLILLVWIISALTRTSDAGPSNPIAKANKNDPKPNETSKSDPPADTKKDSPTGDPGVKKEPVPEPKGEADAAAAAHLERGNAAFAKGDMDAAIRAYSEAIKVQPKSAWAYCKRGQAHMNKSEFALAIADCNKSLELNPKLIDAYAFRCASEFDSKDYTTAIATATLALNLDPKAPFFYFVRGTAHVHKNSLERALEDLDEAIRLDPKNSRFYNSRGMAHAKLGNQQKAQADYEQRDSLQLASMSPAKRQAYQRMLQAEANFKQASALYEADYRRYELQRNTYQAQAPKAAAMGIKLRPPDPPDRQLEQQMRVAEAAFVQIRRQFEQTP